MNKNSRFKNICLTDSLYSLLIFMLINKNEINETFFIFGNSININKDIFKENSIIIPKEKATSKFDSMIQRMKMYSFMKKFVREKKLENLIVYGGDHLTGAGYFIKNHEFRVIEDGIINYYAMFDVDKQIDRESSLVKTLKYATYLYYPYGFSDSITKIYLTKEADVPAKLKNKVETISLKHLWDSSSDEKKAEILKVFGLNKNLLQELSQKENILLTQPFSEDNIITEDEKCEMYKNIMKNYDESTTVIKTHPREKTDYRALFPKAVILDKPFPFELFSFLDANFKRAITLFSTSVMNLGENKNGEKIQIDFYGTKINDKIFERFGDVKLEDFK